MRFKHVILVIGCCPVLRSMIAILHIN